MQWPASMAISKGALGRPRALIESMRLAYLTCESYRDDGDVEVIVRDLHGTDVLRREFSTAFVRPSMRLAVGFAGGPGVTTWTDGQAVRTTQPVPTHAKGGSGVSLDAILSAQRAFSADVSVIVPALLAPEQVGPGWWRRCRSFQLSGAEVFDGVLCDVIETDLGQPLQRVRLWLDRDRHLLRRRVIEYVSGVMGAPYVRYEVRYRPEMDVELPASELAFEP
jgi:hypothetical protein